MLGFIEMERIFSETGDLIKSRSLEVVAHTRANSDLQ